MILVATDHWTLEGRVEDAVLELTRTRREFEGALDIEVEADAIAGIAHGFEARHGLVIDTRNGPQDDRPNLEAAMRRFICLVAQPFERVAVVVATHAAMHRMARLTKDLAEKPLITLNPAQADEHACGIAETGVRRRPRDGSIADSKLVRGGAAPRPSSTRPAPEPTTRSAPEPLVRRGSARPRRPKSEELPTTAPPPVEAATLPPASERRGDASSPSGEELASAFVMEQLAEEVAALACELDAWAMVREKVIDKLDIRGARAARATSREIRAALQIVKSSASGKPDVAALYGEIQELLARGAALMKAPAAVIEARSPFPRPPRASPPPARRSRNPSRRPSAPSAASGAATRATRRPR